MKDVAPSTSQQNNARSILSVERKQSIAVTNVIIRKLKSPLYSSYRL
jgi:hypothetical protein